VGPTSEYPRSRSGPSRVSQGVTGTREWLVLARTGTPGRGRLQEVEMGGALLGFVGGGVQQSRRLCVGWLRIVTQVARWQVVVPCQEWHMEEGHWG